MPGDGRRWTRLLSGLLLMGTVLGANVRPARAYFNQPDGNVIPVDGSSDIQDCLDSAGTGEGGAGVLRAREDARILPEAFRPVEDPPGSGHYPVTFRVVAEGGIYRNSVGYYFVDESVSDVSHLHMVFSCRTRSGAMCGCPCNPDLVRWNDGSSTSHTVTVDFADVPGFSPGRAIAFWIRTPQPLTGGDPFGPFDRCGEVHETENRIYFTSRSLNDDGDYIHYLLYRSVTYANTYYFGFEDLFRGGDNDFEDILIRVHGLVPICEPEPETCNGADDDCDLVADEGVTEGCSTACGSGVRTCEDGGFGACSAPEPSDETCNGVDDNCDGEVDESLTRSCSTDCGGGTEICRDGSYADCDAPLPSIETCDGEDNDCDGSTDEDLTQGCATICGSGEESCESGEWVGCTAPEPTEETCNGLDDDCDGLVDGLTRTCSTDCGAGVETCSAGEYGGCTAPSPGTEACNGNDDDCDGETDESLERTCSTACGTGTESCDDGNWQGCDAPEPAEEACNNADDDCDGVIDDGDPEGGAPCVPAAEGGYTVVEDGADGGVGTCTPGTVICVAGALECRGASGTTREICNCADDDCDGQTDEAEDGDLCPGGACVDCTCVSPCGPEEFPCPVGRYCERSYADPLHDLSGYCLAGLCADVTCTEQEVCNPGTGTCLNVCAGRTCPAGEICIRGSCIEDNCYGRGCPAGERCRNTECESDPCAGVECPTGELCSEGECVPAAEGAGEHTSPRRVLAAGGGGTVCSASSAAHGGAGAYVVLATLLLALVRRRRLWTLAGPVSVALGLGGCNVEPFCLNDCPAGAADAGSGSGTGGDAQGGLVDGCTPTGEERCDGVDNDCDGIVDEGFLLDTDPNNCGTCEHGCRLPHAFPSCVGGACAVGSCEIGWHDINENATDGCEYECPPSGTELCDRLDNDCDTAVDEDFDLTSDRANCGSCGHVCEFSNAAASCDGSACIMGECNPGYVDGNDDEDDGCEYECTKTADVETCNGVDDNCDRRIDEDFLLLTDPTHCGTCGHSCAFTWGVATCSDGLCTLDHCETNHYDINEDPEDGCEYGCVTSSETDLCDGEDNDCDGTIDNEDPRVGVTCGTDTGECIAGITACELGELVCAGVVGPTRDGCNGRNDDCDESTDEDDPQAGIRCGATNTGACEYGSITCVEGELSCLGSFVGPADETCNGIDDDCDGAVDDSPAAAPATPESCERTAGVCAGRTPTCQGVNEWQCDYPETYQAVETLCDGLDNDCDGSVDEGCLHALMPADIRVDTGTAVGAANSLSPALASDGGDLVFAVWADQAAGAARIYYSRSIDGGDAWRTSAARVDTGPGPAAAPRLAVLGADLRTVVPVWVDFRRDRGQEWWEGFRQIWSRRTTTGFASFAASDQRINPSQGTDSFGLDVATAGARVYAVYENFVTTRTRHVFLVTSLDSGASWSAPLQVDHGATADIVAATPKVAAQGENVYIVWRDNRNGATDVFVNVSEDGGSSVATSDTRLDVGSDEGASASFSPVLAAEGDRVYVAWVDGRSGASFDIYLNRSEDRGHTWQATDATPLDDDPLAHDSIEPRIVAPSADRVLVGWIDYRYGFADVFAAVSSDGGGSFESPARMDTGTAEGVAGSLELALGAQGDLVVAVWSDDRSGLLDVFANFSLDGGATWQPQDYRMDTTAIAGSSDSVSPAVHVAGGVGHVVWVDHRNGDNGDIYYRRLE